MSSQPQHATHRIVPVGVILVLNRRVPLPRRSMRHNIYNVCRRHLCDHTLARCVPEICIRMVMMLLLLRPLLSSDEWSSICVQSRMYLWLWAIIKLRMLWPVRFVDKWSPI